MNPELRDLRDAMRAESAPPRVEHNVMVAFRERNAPGRANRRWMPFAAAAAACAVVIAGVFAIRYSAAIPAAPAAITARIAPPVLRAPADTPEPVRVARVRAPRPRSTAKQRAAVHTPEDVATDFLALPYAPPLPDDAAAQVVRVRLPRSAMRTVGLPFDERRAFERVPADVLLGEDGLARAVRFVKVAR